MHSSLYQDEDYLAVHKPERHHYDEILATLSINTAEWEPVHRLDYETSGVLLFAKPPLVEGTRQLFQDPDSSLRKLYLAGAGATLPEALLPEERPDTNGEVRGWIGQRYRGSKTVRFSFAEPPRKGWHSLRPVRHLVRPASVHPALFLGTPYEVELLTGARHQIRAFFKAAEAPLRGDPLYGTEGDTAPRLELHAWKLEFTPPHRPTERIEIEAPL